MRSVRWLGFIGGLVLVVLIMVWFGQPDSESRLVIPGVNEVTANDHIRGAATSSVTLVEYSDFQCPACAQYEPALQRLLEDYGTIVRLVYRHFPLMGHPHAVLAAQASEAAAAQGKFWEMHDMLFTNQSSWSKEANPKNTFIGYARQLGLDESQFKDALGSDAVEDKIKSDTASGDRARVDATPTFFLNGMRIKPSSDYARFKSLIEGSIRTSTTSTTP